MLNRRFDSYGLATLIILVTLAACSSDVTKPSFGPAATAQSASSASAKFDAPPLAGPATKGFQWYSSQVNVPANQLSVVTLNCPQGRPFVVSGGGSGAGYGLIIIASYPTATGNGWNLEVNDSYESGSKTVTVYALCKRG
jgi:hypothetical protein